MTHRDSRGVSVLEFSLVLPWMVLLFLGTVAIGINLIRGLQVVQLSRDAGHMFARGMNFSLPGNKKILQRVGQSVGLDAYNTSSSQAVVYLSALTWVDRWTCKAGGKADTSNPPNPVGCTNHRKWVFTRPQLNFGNVAVKASTYGTPTGMVAQTDGTYRASDYVTQAGAVVAPAFSRLNLDPPPETDSAAVPTGEMVFLSEAAVRGFGVPGVGYTGPPLVAYGVF